MVVVGGVFGFSVVVTFAPLLTPSYIRVLSRNKVRLRGSAIALALRSSSTAGAVLSRRGCIF